MQVVIELLRDRFGLDPTRGGLLGTLDNYVASRLVQLGIDERSYVARVRDDVDEQQRLVHAITVRHSWFYRDPGQLEGLAASLRARRERALVQPVEIWVAGCACGEEAWTIAMIAADLDVPIRMRATDLDAASLAEAAAGQYGAWSLRELPEHLRRYLEPLEQKRWQVGARLRSTAIEFAVHNLCDPPTGSFDLVSCRNVLIYFEPERAQAVADQLRQCLRPGGELILGAGDLLFRPDDSKPHPRVTTRPAARPRIQAGTQAGTQAGIQAGRSVSAALPRPSAAPESSPSTRARSSANPTPSPVRSPAASRTTATPEPATPEPATPGPATPGPATPGPATPGPPPRGSVESAAQAVETGEFDRALALLAELVAVDPLDPEAHLWTGIAHFGLKQEQQAAEALRRARCLAPHLWPATLFAALTNERRGMWDAATRCWAELARTMSSDDAPSIQGTATLLDALPRWRAEALSLARQRNSKHPGGASNV